MTEDDLDPMIQKIFNQIKQFQQMMIYRAFETGLKDYLRFLLGFAYRSDEVRNSEIVHTIERQKFINLTDANKNDVRDVPPGAITNDLTLIPRQWGPMIRLELVLEETGKSRLNRKMKIISSPDYEDVSRDMFSVVVSMHESLKGIKRVESVVFPLLKLKNEFLQRPEFAHNIVLLNITKLIEKLLKECVKYVRSTLKSCTKYVDEIFQKKPESITLDLKKRTFALITAGNENSDDDESKKEEEKKEGEAAPEGPGTAESAARDKAAEEKVDDEDT